MILAGQLLLEAPPTTPHAVGRARLAPGFVRVEDGCLAEVVEGAIPTNAEIGGESLLISPGFVDTHVHLPQFNTIGAHGLPLLEWLQRVVFPAESRWADADHAVAETRRVARQLLAHGTTAVCAYATVHHEATASAIETLESAGLRGAVGQVLSNRFAPDALVGEADRLLQETSDLIDRFPPRERVAAAITPRFAVSCDEPLLLGCGQLAREHPGALVQTHLSETTPECDRVSELFGGRSYVDVYDDARLVTDRTLFGHGVHLRHAERERLRETGAVIAHCPTANSFLRSGAMDRVTTLADGVRVSLGSDIGAGYERSMVRVARAMIETASALGESYPAPAEAWWTITAGNADAARLTSAGRLRAGAPADLLVVRPDIPWLEGAWLDGRRLDGPIDPLARLLFAWDDRWIDRVLTRGEMVYASDRT